MTPRRRDSLWGKLHSLGALTRAGLRDGSRAVAQAAKRFAKQAAGMPLTLPGLVAPGIWTAGVVTLPTGATRRYRFYRPPGARATLRLPLLVMLHGCGQDAERFARSTRLHRLAARERFCVLYPEQDRLANPHACWNWFEVRSGRAFAEADSIAAAIEQVCTQYHADLQRVAVAGLSAGASMAALLATRYPALFKAVAMHSGIAPGAAHSTTTAFSAMHGHRTPTPLPVTNLGASPLPPLLVIQGLADAIVRPSNGRNAAQLWADAAGAVAAPARTVQRGARHAMTLTDFKCDERIVATLCEVDGLGHAWSGGATGQAYSDPKGPSASRMIWAFVADRLRS